MSLDVSANHLTLPLYPYPPFFSLLYSAKESVVSLDVSADGRHVVSMGPVAEVNVWDTATFLR